MRIYIGPMIVILLLAVSFSVIHPLDGEPTRGITGKSYSSSGLPQSASFSTVEVFDHDDDGKDEIYLGGAGRGSPKIQGIQAYEYNPSTKAWSAYGSGLPGTSSGDYYGALGLGDVNKDGNMDIVAPCPTQWYSSSTKKVEIFTSNSQGAFTLAHTFSPEQSTNEAEIADIDGDGSMDIAYSTYKGVEVQFGSGSATSWTKSSPSAAGNEIDGIALGDLNNDGLMEIVATPYFSSTAIRLYVQGASRSWTEITFKDANSEAFGIKIADLNNDGYNDVVYGDRNDNIYVWCGNGGGSTGGTAFSWTDNSSGLPTDFSDPQQVELGDVNEDGKLDIIASANGKNYSRIFLNNQPNAWTEMFSSSRLYLGSGADGYGANFGDWDGDGHLDAAGCSWGNGVDAWIINHDSAPPPENDPPMPDAGADQEIMLGETVNLDGTGSSDPEDAPSGDTAGDILTYDWNVTSYPTGSLIRDGSLSPSDSSAVPSFVPDKVGTYVLTLSVKDSKDKWSNLSDEDEVTIIVHKPNDPPVADAGPDASDFVGEEIFLDGSDSHDIDGEIEYHEWSCTSHTVTINDQGTATVSFTPDTASTYNFRLRVRDDNDTWSAYDHVNVTAVEVGQNIPPIADAGPNQEVMLGDTVTLDGSMSMDNDGDIVTWEWTCTSHTVEFTAPNSSSPIFTPAVAGTYSISLRVKDNNGSWSSTDTVEIFVEEPYFNSRPVADAGEDIEVHVGDLVTLDGRGSSDQNGDIISYNWTCTSHEITLNSALTARPSFVPDASGTYVFTLAVSDDEDAWSVEDGITVTVLEVPEDLTFTITLGPFQYDDDTPVIGAEVVLTVGMETLTSTTDGTGSASFADIPEGEHSAMVVLGGVTVIASFPVEVENDGGIYYPDGYGKAVKEDPVVDDDDVTPPEDDDSDEDGSSAGLVIGVIFAITLLAGGGVGLFLFMNRKKEEEEEKKCPHCGGDMEYSEDFDRSKCRECGRYS